VFSTLEKALRYKELQGHRDRDGDEIGIEPHVLDDENDTGPRYPMWWVMFNNAGDKVGCGYRNEKPEPFEAALHKPEVRRVPADCRWHMLSECRPGAALMVDNVSAPTEEHAVKVAADERAMFLTRIAP